MRLTLQPIPATRAPAHPRRFLCLFSALLFTFTAVLAHAQEYTSIVVFGDSLSDTGNVAALTEKEYGVRVPGPGPFGGNYADGRFTDGDDTLPAAQKYFGLWIEQYAALLPAKPIISNSLDGGTDYAYGSATTGSGTTLVTLGPLSVNVNNMGQQITDYLATSPVISDRTLFVVWGGSNDILNATSVDDIFQAAVNQANNIQRLIHAGATQFIIPNLPPLGLVPALNGNPKASIPATAASALFNQLLSAGLAILQDLNRGKHLHLAELDVFSLFYKIVASPAKYGLVNITGTSQGVDAVDPDTYLFWDDLHPTTAGHNILALTAAGILPGVRAESVPADGGGH
jgi:phospholipase/lecithinase/hemolysin